MKKTDNTSFKPVLITCSVIILIALVLIIGAPQRSSRNMPFAGMMGGANIVTTESASSGVVSSIGAYDGSSMMLTDSFASTVAPMVYGGKTAAEADQKIIKTADLSVGVDGVAAKTTEIATLATGRGGFVQSSTIVEDEAGYKTGYITIRVPTDTFEDTIQAIKDLAVRVNRESINGQDVTEQYTDLEARLRAAKAEEEQYLTILEKAETVQDILSVQSYLQNVRYEIESLQGQIDSLGNQTDYSTISVTLEEEVRVQVPTEKFDLVRDVKLALKYVVVLAQAALTFVIWFVIVGGAILIPVALFIALAIFVVRKIMARF
ncbi:MAG: hypothetical protein QG626_108 [Patescibacteria group bacterium]|jgi:hypothetical protein|nr:hypothetical protein [Patescibacteria group bacterium]